MAKLFFRLILGLIGGAVATGPMTIAMVALHKKLPPGRRHSLPPREITSKLTRALGIRHRLSEDAMATATLVNHFAYGAAAGVSLATVKSFSPVQALAIGPIYGVIVWALSYLGILPTGGILKPATRHAPERNILMVVAHLIWGFTLALFIAVVRRDREAREGILFSSPSVAHRDA